MAKELPYFKFFVSEWTDGDITLEDYDVQGFFINLCSYYWSKECDVTLTKALKKFRDIDIKVIDLLKESNIIKINDGNIIINFLDEQRSERNIKTLINRENGLKGGRPKNPTKSESKPKNNPVGYDSVSETKANQKAIREEKRRKEKKREELYNDFLISFNNTTSRKFKILDDKSKRQLNARLKEGFTVDDIIKATINCSKDQYHLDNPQYLTPEFITRPDKLQKYLNATQVKPIKRLQI